MNIVTSKLVNVMNNSGYKSWLPCAIYVLVVLLFLPWGTAILLTRVFFFFCIIATQSYSLNKARVYISSSNINSLYLHTLKRFKVANGIFIVVLFETDVTAWDWHVWKLLKFISYLVYFYTPWKHQKIGIEWFREVILPWRNVFSCFNKAIFLLWPKYHRGTKMAVTNLRILSLQNCAFFSKSCRSILNIQFL